MATKLKRRKWYSTTIKPDSPYRLIVMTDMGYMFEAIYSDNKFLVSIVRNGKVYYEECEEWIQQENIVKWMKV